MISRDISVLVATLLALIVVGCKRELIVTTTYPDGKLKSTCTLRNGMMNGLYQGWYETGNQEFYLSLSNGVNQGPFASFCADGTKSSEGNYKNDKLDGWYFAWHTNGVLREIVYYKDGNTAGDILTLLPSGKVNFYIKHSVTGGVESWMQVVRQEERVDGNGHEDKR